MQLTKLGHACLHITDGDASVLLDPGSWSSGFEDLRGLSAILADIPRVTNVGYLIGETVFHPGDSFTEPDVVVPVLALPTGAPWLRTGEAVDFLRAVAPAVAVPIHERTLAMPEMEYGRFRKLAPADTEIRVLTDGGSTVVTRPSR